jgi:hypothetical protein
MVTVTGGTPFSSPEPHYKYSIEGGSWQDNNTFNELAAGHHSVAVKDANGCIKAETFVITEASNTDVSLGAVFSDNIFRNNGDEITVVYNISEVAGKAATLGTLRIYKPAGYTILSIRLTNYSVSVDNTVGRNNICYIQNSRERTRQHSCLS